MEFVEIIKDALVSVNKLKGVLARALIFHFIVFMLIEATTYTELPQAFEWIAAVISTYIYVLVAITTHRILLLGPGAVPTYGIIGFSVRELRYVMYIIGLTLLVIPGMFFAYIPFIGLALYFAFLIWIWGRSSLVFPGTALNEDFDLANAWAVTKGYNFMMVVVVMIYPIILNIPAYFIEELPYGSFVNVFLYMITTVMEVSALSMAYKYFVVEPRTMDAEME